ncbi:MAG TPA: hypothetical protein PK185_04985 [Cyclobacteriaceae bacterium]|nr:hypothetical protein [Cyclobacteriaceae bacterium]
MKVKLLFLLLAIASLFSFVLRTNTSEVKVKKAAISNESILHEKEPMQPFAMTDRNQFD